MKRLTLTLLLLTYSIWSIADAPKIRPDGVSKAVDWSKHCYVADKHAAGKQVEFVEGDVYHGLLRCKRNTKTDLLHWVKVDK